MSRLANRLAPDPVILSVPLPGSCRVQNSPANRVPSHGTDAFGSSYAIDLVPVDAQERSAPRTWRRLITAEPPEIFVGFGRPILAPAAGRVALVHDGEPDHETRRSQLALMAYMLGQPRRAQRGAPGLAGNHVVIALGSDGPFVLLAHLQLASVHVQPGQPVTVGDPVAQCGNSGNSTEPHLHLQVSDSTDWTSARGLPFAFRRPDGTTWMPPNSQIVSS
jgi:Peptidase family M23